MSNAKTIITLLLIVGLTVSCRERDKHGKIVDTPTSGEITITADESLRPLVEAEVNAFQRIYPYAKIQVKYLSEVEAINAVLMDSARLALVTRKMLPDELSSLEREKIIPVQTAVATGAVALIINKNNTDSLLSVSQLREILTGNITRWNQINPSSRLGDIEMVFDNPGSGIARFLKDSLGNGKELPKNCYAVKDNPSVVNYVAVKKNVIGLIGAEWISDHDDSIAQSFLKSIRVVSMAGDSGYAKPYQAYVALHQYPLSRSTVIVSREARTGLGSGFTAFVASDKGQRIILKAGLVPKTMPIRIVEINRNE